MRTIGAQMSPRDACRGSRRNARPACSFTLWDEVKGVRLMAPLSDPGALVATVRSERQPSMRLVRRTAGPITDGLEAPCLFGRCA